MSVFNKSNFTLHQIPWAKLVLLFILIFSFTSASKQRWSGENWKDIVVSDGIGYYSYLPATFIYNDYTYSFIDSVSPNYPSLQVANHAGFCNSFNGKPVNKYFVGEAVLLAPFYLLGHLATKITNGVEDGYSFYYILSVSIGAIFYLLLGLWCIRKLLLRFKVSELHAAIILLCIYLGTNLFYYSQYCESMTHIYSFGLVACFALLVHKQMERFSAKRLLGIAVLLGLITLIRPINVVVVLSLPFLAGNFETLKSFFSEAFNQYLVLIAALGSFLGMLFIQLFYYYLQCGKWFVYAYSKEGFDFAHPNFFNCLFSYSNGFYVYAPILFIATIGIFTKFKKEKFQFFSFVIFFTAFTWAISSWWAWTYGGAFGMRPFVEYIPFFAICFGFLMNALPQKKLVLPSISILLFLPLVALIQFQVWQFRLGIIACDNMTKQMYWRVFLENREQFYFINSSNETIAQIPTEAKLIYSTLLDFEKTDTLMDQRSIIHEKAFTGKRCLKLCEENNHAPRWKIAISDLIADSISKNKNSWVEINSKWMLEDNGSEARMCCLLKHRGQEKEYFNDHSFIIHQVSEENKWTNVRWAFKLPETELTDTLYIFPARDIWYPVYIDDITIKIYTEETRK